MNKNLLLLSGGFFLFAAALLSEEDKKELPKLFNFPDDFGEKLLNIITFAEEEPVQAASDRIEGIDVMARTIWGEARGQGYAGMQAVANVIMNRYKLQTKRYGLTIEEVCKKPYQFSVWNEGDPSLQKMLSVDETNAQYRRAVTIADRALRGELPDNTGGANHYLNIDFTREIRGGTLPSWVDFSKKTASIGDHTFLKLT